MPLKSVSRHRQPRAAHADAGDTGPAGAGAAAASERAARSDAQQRPVADDAAERPADHARIENHSFRLTPRPLDLTLWLQQQQQFYHPLMRDGGPQLHVAALTPLPASVMLDSDRLQQVVNNLVANALKFTRHGEIRLTLAVTGISR